MSLYTIKHTYLQTTNTRSNLGGLRIDATKELSLVVGKLVHRGKRNIERARGSVVDGSDVDGSAIERQLPARSTRSTVEASDRSCTSDVRETGEAAECREAWLI